jgi:hypothetical protein
MQHLGPQFHYPENMDTATSNERFTFGRAHRAYGTGRPEFLFGEGQTAPAPWPNAGKTKKGPAWDKDTVHRALSKDPVLEDYDPRNLHASQPSIVKTHVDYYMSDSYRRTGATAADAGNVGNQYPTVYHTPDGKRLLLSGHHRAAAALLQGQPLRARTIRPD